MNNTILKDPFPTAKTVEELHRQQDAAFALANSELEGYKTPAALSVLFARHVSGEITLEELFSESDRLLAEGGAMPFNAGSGPV